jgi:hypothetical protein
VWCTVLPCLSSARYSPVPNGADRGSSPTARWPRPLSLPRRDARNPPPPVPWCPRLRPHQPRASMSKASTTAPPPAPAHALPRSLPPRLRVWRPVLILIRAPPPAISAAASSPPSPVISVAVRTWVRSDLRLVAIPVLILFRAPTPTLHPISDMGEDDKVIVERCARERSRPPAAPHHRQEAARGDAQAVTLFLLHPRPPLGPRGRAIQRGTVLPIKVT